MQNYKLYYKHTLGFNLFIEVCGDGIEDALKIGYSFFKNVKFTHYSDLNGIKKEVK